MSTAYTYVTDLAKEAEAPPDGILSRTLLNDDQVKAVIFGFGQGQVLSEHTASVPAILHLIQGEATIMLGDDTVDARTGTWIHMPAEMRHSVQATTPVVLLLLLLKGGKLGGNVPQGH
jgi:quercetin dioxygenase-like cupin family protein